MKSKKLLIIAGPTRTGSTALFRAMAPLERARASKLKEVNYFLNLDNASYGRLDYLQQLDVRASDAEDTLYFEASPKYFASVDAPVELASLLAHENYRVAVILREPMARLNSIMMHIMTKRSIGRYRIMDDLARIQVMSEINQQADDLDSQAFWEGAYLYHLQRWILAVGRERLGIFFYDDLLSGKLIRQVADFSGLDYSESDKKPTVENKSRAVKNYHIHQNVKRVNDWLEPLLNRYPQIRSVARRVYYSFNESPVTSDLLLSDEYIKQFQSAYTDLNRGLRAFLIDNDVNESCIPEWVPE